MYAVSDRFLASLRQAHTIRVKAQLIVAGEVVLDDLAVESGSVTMDRTNTHQRTAQITLVEPLLLPVDAHSSLAPFGAEMRIWRGVRWFDGTEELVPLITGPIQDSDASLGDYVTSLSIDDRSRKVADAKFETTYQIAAGTDPAEAWTMLILSRVNVPISAISTLGFVTPLLTYPSRDDPWEAAQSLAASVGAVSEFDGLGECRLRSIVTPTGGSAPWTVNDGADGVLIGGSVSMSRRDSANRIYGTGGNSSTSSVWQSVATDDDPSSPSYYSGDFGPKPDWVDFPAAGSQEATDTATLAELNKRRGVARKLSVTSIVNPALLLDDAVAVQHTDTGINEIDLVDRITIDLTHSGVQGIDTRTVQAA